MALKQLILSDKIKRAREKLSAAQAKQQDTQQKRAELDETEQQLIQAKDEVTEATTDEEMKVLEEQIAAWEEQEQALSEAEETIAQEIEAAQEEIAALEAQLEEVNNRARAKKPEEECKERKIDMSNTMKRRKYFGMDHQEREAFAAREDVKGFAKRVRSMIEEKRAVSGAELTIPQVMLPMIRQVAEENSKLMKHVNVQSAKGEGRVNVMGIIPEAVWTEMAGKINEVNWSFGQVELDGYKVAAGLYLHNSVVEDSDLDLVSEVIDMLGRAIGIAVDKAILYGTGTKMPKGIVTRLAEVSKPAGYSDNAPEWTNLSTTNLLAVTGKTGAQLFQAIVEATGAINSKYTTGATFWTMNRKTKIKLVSNALSINAAGAVVTGIDNTMPVIGGAIEELDFIPDDVIIGGYGDMYCMLERAGMQLAYSNEYHFMQDETAFRGTARYDGQPVVADAFVAIGIGGTKPAADAVTFTADTANAG